MGVMIQRFNSRKKPPHSASMMIPMILNEVVTSSEALLALDSIWPTLSC